MPRPELTKTQALLLGYLNSNSNKAVSRDELSENVWGTPYRATTRTIDQTVATLRRKLAPGEKIVSVRSVGYRLERGD